jgi:hypothetical protein
MVNVSNDSSCRIEFLISAHVLSPYHAFLVNVFRGIFRNPLFCAVLLITAGCQAVIIEFGGDAMHVITGGLSGKYWGISIAFGVGSLIMQQVINVAYRLMTKREHVN